MKRFLVAATVLLCLGLSGNVFAQTSNNGSLSGIVQDSSKAVIPGVTVTATNTGTGVENVTITNDSGAFNFQSLLPGDYKVVAELMGFKKSEYTGISIRTAQSKDLEITLGVGEKTDIVIVDTKKKDVVFDTTPSIGISLDEQQIRDLPMVGNDVLLLLPTLPGYRANALGHEYDSIGGLPMTSVNTIRDGLSVTDGRYTTGVSSTTVLNTDMIAEIRLILAPVDAEVGRGNAQVQVTTKSGSNDFKWTLNYNIRQNALNSAGAVNTNCPNPTVQATCFKQPFAVDFNYTAGAGGPIVKNHTFYYVNWDQNMRFSRNGSTGGATGAGQFGGIANAPVLTPMARQGIFRYFEGWNNANASFLVNQTAGNYPVVDQYGNAIAPKFWASTAGTTAYLYSEPGPLTGQAGKMVCFSVFGSIKFDGTPFTDADCGTYIGRDASGELDYSHPIQATATKPAAGGAWDATGRPPDPTGYTQKLLSYMPPSNFFFSGNTSGSTILTTGVDGLNSALFQWVRGNSGFDNENAFQGGTFGAGLRGQGAAQVAHKQINIKIDHVFNANHRLNASTSFQNDANSRTAALAPWPTGFNGQTSRVPRVLTVNGTSLLSNALLNEARFGIRYSRSTQVAPWDDPAYPNSAEARSFLLTGGTNATTGITYPILFNPGAANPLQTINGIAGTRSFDYSNNVFAASAYTTNRDTSSPLYNFADTVSWTHGKHTIRGGAESRLTRTTEISTAGAGLPTAFGGANCSTFTVANNAPTCTNVINPSPLATLNSFAELPGGLGGMQQNMAGNAANLLYVLSGSVAGVTQPFWVNTVADFKAGNTGWQDYGTADGGKKYRTQVQNEWALFLKDDVKVRRGFTVNLGVRWEYYGELYTKGYSTGLAPTSPDAQDSGFALWGPTRSRSLNPLDYWMTPGNLFIANYGTTAFATAGSPTNGCQLGVQTLPADPRAVLPISTCDPSLTTTRVFVGPGSDFPNVIPTYRDRNNIGPAIGFSLQLPWLGGGAALRGGYQTTYGSAGRDRSGGTGTQGQLSQLGLGGSCNTAGTGCDSQSSDMVAASYPNLISATRALTLVDLPQIVPLPPPSVSPRVAPLNGFGRLITQTAYSPNYKDPYTHNFTLSLQRSLRRNMTLQLNYVATLGRAQPTSSDINTPNVYYNPELYNALALTRAGGDSPLFDQMFAGLNLAPVGTAGYGPVGTCVTLAGGLGGGPVDAATGLPVCAVGTIYQSGSASMRRSAQFGANLANGDFAAVAQTLMTSVTATGGGLLTTDALAQGKLVRNGCDRLATATVANSRALLVPTATATATDAGTLAYTVNGQTITLPNTPRCFPEDYIGSNPAFGVATFLTNKGFSNYHQFQLQYTAQLSGVRFQGTYARAKQMGAPHDFYVSTLNGTGAFSDPLHPEGDYGLANSQADNTFRGNGTFGLPFGPGQRFFSKSSGLVNRIVSDWQMSIIFNVQSGGRTTLNASNDAVYGTGTTRPDIVGPWQTPDVNPMRNGANGNTTFFGNPIPFTVVQDPACRNLVNLTKSPSDAPAFTFGAAGSGSTCNLTALAMAVPEGTPGAFLANFSGQLKPALVMLQSPLPGHQGSLGIGTMKQPGRSQLDMNVSKAFMFTDRRGIQFRLDATNVLNHAFYGNIGYSMATGFSDNNGVSTAQNSANWGAAGREVQFQVRMINR